jgi:hypothetical protein
MPNKMIFAPLLASFGVPLEVYSSVTNRSPKGGQYIHGEWVPGPDILSEPNKINVTEPFIPYGLLTRSGFSVTFQSGGRMQEADKQWISNMTVPIGSFVVQNGKKYEVIACDPWTDYSDVNIYGCKAVSAFG